MDDDSVKIYKGQAYRENPFIYYPALVFLVYWVSNIGMSRFMLGAHAFDQVLYGWSFGIFFALFLFRYVRPIIRRHVRKLLETGYSSRGTAEFSLHQKALVRKSTLWYIVVALLTWLFLIALCSTLYYVVQSNFTIPDQWI